MADKIEDLIAKLAAQYEQNRAQYEQDAVQYEQINRRIEAAIAQLWAGVPSASELQDRMYDLARPIYYDFLYLIQSAPSSTEAEAAYGMVIGATCILYMLGIMDRDSYERVIKRAIIMLLTRQEELSK
mgnify:FL=1|jgi:hypothetical protein